jgi:hypothetical protein
LVEARGLFSSQKVYYFERNTYQVSDYWNLLDERLRRTYFSDDFVESGNLSYIFREEASGNKAIC